MAKMSVRLLTVRLLKHGRLLLQNYWKRDIHNNILEQKRTHKQQRSQPRFTAFIRDGQKNAGKQVLNAASCSGIGQLSANLSRSPPGLFRFGQHARKLFIDNVLNRVTTTYSAELRNQATKKLFYGDSAPFFALIGVSLASGAGVLTKEDELEGVCWEIREAATRLQNSWDANETAQEISDGNLRIDKLSIGPVLAKGCAAVVYAVKLKSLETSSNKGTESVANVILKERIDYASRSTNMKTDFMTPLHNMSRFVHNFGTSVDNLQLFCQTTRTTAINAFEQSLTSTKSAISEAHRQMIEQACNSRLHIQSMEPTSLNISSFPSSKEKQIVMEGSKNMVDNIQQYPFALKMMFNYDIQSNATAILRAMYKETIPARQRFRNNESEMMWERHIEQQTLLLPPHPNIVCMYGYFCDEVGNFPDGHKLYPIAQPQRINPQGYGRNMSLYLLMKRYDISLRTYLDKYHERMTIRNKLLLLAQLLEAVAHINRHGIAHRDIKTDNILIEYTDVNVDNDVMAPQLVLTDFGCCLADRHYGLQIPYNHCDMDKGGNAALMAPEIINKQPGPFTVLNYDKADLWACGAIAYEIFGLPNPFYQINHGHNGRADNVRALSSASYKEEDLPTLNGVECPKLIQQLIYNILSPNPSKRISPDIAANVMQLFLWAPSQWLKVGQMPNSTEILQWLLSLTTKVMCEARSTAVLSFKCSSTPSFLSSETASSASSASSSSLANSLISYQKNGRRTYIEYTLICSFLARARLRRIRGALNWIQNINEM